MSRSLLKSSSLVGLMTLLSRVLGFARDVLLAIMFGAGAGMDAFLVAFKIPNFMRRVFAEGAFAQSFVPVLSETKVQGSRADVRQLIANVSGTLVVILAGITVLGIVAAPIFIGLFAPGFAQEPQKFALTVELLRWCFPYLFFIALTALAGSVLNTYGKFALPAVAPALLNVCLIVAAIYLAPLFERPIYALAIGVFVAGLVQLALLLPPLWRLGLLPKPRWGWGSEPVRRIVKLMLPIIFASSVAQLALLLDSILASFLVTGSVSWLYYADRLMEFPLGVFTIAIATVALPQLSKQFAAGDEKAFSATVDWALLLVLLICLPSAVGLFVLAGPMLATLFQYSAFSAHDVEMARYSLMAYAFGLLGFSLVKVAAPAYFSRQDTKTPVRYGIIALSCGMTFNIIGVTYAVHAQWIAPHAVLALGTSLGAFLNAGLLLSGLLKRNIYRTEADWLWWAWRLLFAVAVLSGILFLLAGPLEWWLANGAAERFTRLFAVIAAAAAGYFLCLFITGVRPRHFTQGAAA